MYKDADLTKPFMGMNVFVLDELVLMSGDTPPIYNVVASEGFIDVCACRQIEYCLGDL
jgi:hypothetical protein